MPAADLFLSLDFLLQIPEEVRGKEICDRNAKAVAQLFERRHRGAVVAPSDNVIDRGLRDAADGTQLIYRQIVLTAQL